MTEHDQLMHDRVAARLYSDLGEFAHATWNAEMLAEHFGHSRSPQDPRSELPRAFLASGLLDAADAARWEALLATATRPALPLAMTPELRAAIDEHLSALIERARDPGDEPDAWDRIQEDCSDLKRLGLIDDAERELWMARLGLGSDGDDSERPRGARARQRAADLPLRTIAGPQERRRGVRVIAFDLFETDVAVRVVVTRPGRDERGGFEPLPDEIEPGSPFAPRWTEDVALADDLGTRYLVRAGSGFLDHTVDGPLHCRLELRATPGVPLEARRLTFLWAGIPFEVAL